MSIPRVFVGFLWARIELMLLLAETGFADWGKTPTLGRGDGGHLRVFPPTQTGFSLECRALPGPAWALHLGEVCVKA